MDFFAEVNTWTAQSDAEGACQRRLGIAGIGAQVVGMIAPCDAQGARRRIQAHPLGVQGPPAAGRLGVRALPRGAELVFE